MDSVLIFPDITRNGLGKVATLLLLRAREVVPAFAAARLPEHVGVELFGSAYRATVQGSKCNKELKNFLEFRTRDYLWFPSFPPLLLLPLRPAKAAACCAWDLVITVGTGV